MARLQTKEEWLQYAKDNRTVLEDLIGTYHPSNLDLSRRRQEPMEITAPGAEMACATVRTAIAQEEAGMTDPVLRFSRAVEDGDVNTINSLLNSAWFGVPESTSCWNIVGFKEAVELMDQPPDYEGEEGAEIAEQTIE